MDATVAFLLTAAVALLALLVAVRIVPGRFGLEPIGTGEEPGIAAGPASVQGFEARPMEPAALLADQDRRPDVPRRASEPTLAQAIFADGLPSVVHVTTRSKADRRVDTEEYVSDTGSGLVWDERGHIVTCLHVVDDATSALVTLSDGSEWEAKLVGLDESTDIAVVRIHAEASRLTPIRVGSTEDLRVGMRTFSVACPYGLGHSLSVGYVSALNRRIRVESDSVIDGVIQTDAAIHPGSSGGALIDDQGRVIGINAAIHRDSTRQVGVGFALPIDQLQSTVPGIITNGFRWFPDQGFVAASDRYSAQLLAEIEGHEGAPDAGVVVAEALPGGAAELAGLRAMLSRIDPAGDESLVIRDVIVGVNGESVATREALERALKDLPARTELRLTVARPQGPTEVVIPVPGSSSVAFPGAPQGAAQGAAPGAADPPAPR